LGHCKNIRQSILLDKDIVLYYIDVIHNSSIDIRKLSDNIAFMLNNMKNLIQSLENHNDLDQKELSQKQSGNKKLEVFKKLQYDLYFSFFIQSLFSFKKKEIDIPHDIQMFFFFLIS